MKTYQKPALSIVTLNIEHNILAGSGGLDNGDKVGRSYNSGDVTYSRGTNSQWDDEE